MEEAADQVKQHLPFLGESARQYVYEALGGMGAWNQDAQSDITLARIQQGMMNIQQQLGLTHSSRDSAPLVLLDMLGVSRASVYQTLEERIKSNLNATLDSLPETALLTMLDQTVEFIDHNDLNVIPLHIIKNIKKLPDKYLIYIALKNVITDLPITVQRQIWEYNPALFIRYVVERYLSRMEIDNSIVNNISITNQESINQIATCIGGSEKLFSTFASYCCEELVKRKEPAYGILLRAVLLCVENNTNSGSGKLSSLGKLYELARLLDSCKRSKKLDEISFMGVIELLKVIIIAQYNSHMSGINAASAAGNRDKDIKKEKKIQPTKRNTKNNSSHTPLQTLLLDAWQYIHKLDTAHVFAHAVTDDVAPNYSQIISVPMNLSAMASKIESNKYKDINEFDNDMNLMFSNCILYNGATSFYGELASKLCEKWEIKRKEIRSKAAAIIGEVAGSRRTNDLARRLEEALSYMIKLDSDKIFYFRVTDAIAPGYSEYIKSPMDFSTMKKKLDAGKYTTLDIFDYDIKVIFDNCIIYNGADSVYGKLAHSLYQKWKNKMKDLAEKEKSTGGAAVSTDSVVVAEDPEEKYCYCQQPARGDMVACENEQCPLEWFHLECVHMTQVPDGEWYCSNCSPVQSKYDTVAPTTSVAPTTTVALTPSVAPQPKSTDVAASQASTPVPILTVDTNDRINSPEFLLKLLDHAWNYVTHLDSDAIFAYPVQSEEYRKAISSPIDLSTIRVKLGRKKYKSLSDFNSDILLMLQNCLQFNQPDSFFHQTGQYLLQSWEAYHSVLQGILLGERTDTVCDAGSSMDIAVPEVDDTPYCSCRQPSSIGDMVECEGANCKIKWFHLECVKLKVIPDGAWYCKDCSGTTTVTPSTLGKRKVSTITSSKEEGNVHKASAIIAKATTIVTKVSNNTTAAVAAPLIDQNDSSVKQIQKAIMAIASSTRLSFKEIPPIVVENKILWALCLLRDPFFQKLLRLFIVDRLRLLFTNNLKINPFITVKSTVFSLPSDDTVLHLAVQICQLSGGDQLEITHTNTQYFRCHLPVLLLHKIKKNENNQGKNMNYEESKSIVSGLVNTNRALKLLAMDILQAL